MIKHIIIILLLIILHHSLAGQENPNINIYSSFNHFEEVKLHFIYDLTKSHHSFGLGFNLPVNPSVTQYGFDYSYKYFTSKNTETFNWFFLYHGQINRRHLHSSSTSKGISWINTVGYGFQLNLTPAFYVSHQTEAGIEKAWFKESGSFNDLALSVNLGIGYNIRRKK